MFLTLTYNPHWLQTVNATLCGFDHISAWVAVTVTAYVIVYASIYPPNRVYTPCAQALRTNVACRAHVFNRVCRIPRGLAILQQQTLRAAGVICVTLLQTSPVVSLSFDSSQLQNEASILWFYPATQGMSSPATLSLMCLYFLLPLPLSWSFLPSSTAPLPAARL